jgi:hypothetical protein
MARKAQGMEKKIPVIAAIIAGAGLLVAAIAAGINYYAATKPAAPPVLVAAPPSAPGVTPIPMVEQQGSATGGMVINAAKNAEVGAGKVCTPAQALAPASASASAVAHSLKQTGNAGPGGVVINADEGAKVSVDTAGGKKK